MEFAFIIGIVIFIIWIFSGSNTRKSSYSSNHSTDTNRLKQSTNFNQTFTPVVSRPATISVSPKKIESNPDIKFSLVDGEYRYFQNHHVNGVQYTFGFPKHNCHDKRVWVGIGSEEVERISYSEAMGRIRNRKLTGYNSKSLTSNRHSLRSNSNSESKVGYCSNCNKKLRGNIYKKFCTECYHNGFS